MWEHFHHQADIGIRGIGATLAEAFEGGAAALMGVICSPETVQSKEAVEMECEADEMDFFCRLDRVFSASLKNLKFIRGSRSFGACRGSSRASSQPGMLLRRRYAFVAG